MLAVSGATQSYGQVLLQNAKVQNANLSQPVASGGSSVSFVRIQFKHTSGSDASFDSNITAGNCILVAVTSFGTAATSCVDSLGNTYSLVDTATSGGNHISIFVSFTTIGGACFVTQSGASSFVAVTAIEYSGPTSVADHNHASGTNPSVSLTTSANAMFYACYDNESTDAYTSSALNPGSVAGVLINKDIGQITADVEWLNSSAGFAAGSYTLDLTGTGLWAGIALK